MLGSRGGKFKMQVHASNRAIDKLPLSSALGRARQISSCTHLLVLFALLACVLSDNFNRVDYYVDMDFDCPASGFVFISKNHEKK